MTLVVTILIGAGAVLISSAIDCSDIKSTFFKIINNQPIDWTGNACQGTGTQTPTSGAPATIGAGTQGRLVPPLSNGRCPPGTTQVYVSGGKIMCELPA